MTPGLGAQAVARAAISAPSADHHPSWVLKRSPWQPFQHPTPGTAEDLEAAVGQHREGLAVGGRGGRGRSRPTSTSCVVTRPRPAPRPAVDDLAAAAHLVRRRGCRRCCTAHEALVLDRPGPRRAAVQCPTRRGRPRSRHDEQLRARVEQQPEQLGEPQVVAGRQARCTEPPARRRSRRATTSAAGLHQLRLALAEAEPVDLAVRRQQLAVRPEEQRGVPQAAAVRPGLGRPLDDEPACSTTPASRAAAAIAADHAARRAARPARPSRR